VCKKVGLVEIPQHTDVYSAVYLIEDAHRKVSPECKNPTTQIQVLTEKGTVNDLPKWAQAKARELLKET